MGAVKKASALAAALLLAVLFALPAAASPLREGADSSGSDGSVPGGAAVSVPLTLEAKQAAEWLRAKVPKPAPGDEWMMLALLRSGQAAGADEYTRPYLEKLLAKAEKSADEQRLSTSARQMLTLAAAGVNAAEAVPALTAPFADNERLAKANFETKRLTLLAFGPAGVPPPVGYDGAELARQLANARNLDGGYGEDETSDAVTTARMLQALAFYRNDGVVENAVIDARDWLYRQQSSYGGFDVKESPSAEATAECAIALACLSEETLKEGVPSPASALAVFRNEDGGYMPDPGKKSNADLTCLVLLAQTSQLRLEASLVPVYRMSDVVFAVDEPDEAAEGLITIPGLPPLSNGALLAILAGVAAVIVLLSVLVAAGRDARRYRKLRKRVQELRDAGRLPPGLDPDDDDIEELLRFDYEYVGDELREPPGEESSNNNKDT